MHIIHCTRVTPSQLRLRSAVMRYVMLYSELVCCKRLYTNACFAQLFWRIVVAAVPCSRPLHHVTRSPVSRFDPTRREETNRNPCRRAGGGRRILYCLRAAVFVIKLTKFFFRVGARRRQNIAKSYTAPPVRRMHASYVCIICATGCVTMIWPLCDLIGYNALIRTL